MSRQDRPELKIDHLEEEQNKNRFQSDPIVKFLTKSSKTAELNSSFYRTLVRTGALTLLAGGAILVANEINSNNQQIESHVYHIDTIIQPEIIVSNQYVTVANVTKDYKILNVEDFDPEVPKHLTIIIAQTEDSLQIEPMGVVYKHYPSLEVLKDQQIPKGYENVYIVMTLPNFHKVYSQYDENLRLETIETYNNHLNAFLWGRIQQLQEEQEGKEITSLTNLVATIKQELKDGNMPRLFEIDLK